MPIFTSRWRGDVGTAMNTYLRPVFHWVRCPDSSLSSSYLNGDSNLHPSLSKVSSMSLLLELRGTSLTNKRVDCTSVPSGLRRNGFVSLSSTCTPLKSMPCSSNCVRASVLLGYSLQRPPILCAPSIVWGPDTCSHALHIWHTVYSLSLSSGRFLTLVKTGFTVLRVTPVSPRAWVRPCTVMAEPVSAIMANHPWKGQ